MMAAAKINLKRMCAINANVISIIPYNTRFAVVYM